MRTSLPSRDLVLIGAGHTNLHIVRMWRMQPIPDARLTVISPFSRATYSGMLPGTLAGLYERDEMEIDLYRLSTGCGARLIVEEVTGFDPQARRVHFADRPPVRFDVASIGIGSVPSAGALWRNRPNVLSIKPMATFLSRLEARLRELAPTEADRAAAKQLVAVAATESAGKTDALDETFPDADVGAADQPASKRPNRRGRPAICVVGAGAAGVEVTLCLEGHLTRRGLAADLTLVDSSDTILAGYAAKTVRLAADELRRRGVSILLGKKVTEFENGRLLFADGRTQDAALVIWATGAAPPPVLEQFELPKAVDGFLAVRPTLQTTADFPVFVVGDTATFVDVSVPKAGVYAVREGPVLWDNIQRVFAGRELRSYDPQKGFLSLLATGDGRAIAQYKGLAAHGRWVWTWKNYIDKKFMRMFQDYRPMSPEMMARRTQTEGRRNRKTEEARPAMRCRGCGGKVGANVLAAALERLDIPASDFVRQGLNPPADAAVLNTEARTADVLSVDFFHAFLDDPYVVGRVAALNSLSDLWATGAQPLGAMAIVTLPEGPQTQQAELLYQLLAGGLRELKASGAALLGGHTTEGDELAIGYSVIGGLDGKRPFSKGHLKPGDRLILTKPLGTGVLLAGLMQCETRAEWIDAMLQVMLSSAAEAARIAREFDANAVTDVTGFGLAGHLLEMLDASGVGATISLEKLPLLEGFDQLSRQGMRSTLDPANRQSEDRIEFGSPELRNQPAADALFDPQTSGGLLIGVREEAADEMVERLREAGYPSAAVIGAVTSPERPPELRIA